MVIHKGFSATVFCYKCPWWGCYAQNVPTLKRKTSVFLIVEKTEWMGDSTRTKKLKLLCKLAAKVLIRRVQFVNPSAGFVVFFHFSFARCFFFSHTLLDEVFCFLPSHSHHVTFLILSLIILINWCVIFTHTFCDFNWGQSYLAALV